MKRILVTTLMLAVTVSLVACGAPTGGDTAAPSATGADTGTMVKDAKDNASIAACRTSRAQIDQLYSMAQSTGEAADFAAVVQQSGAKCPSGGTYSLDAATGKAVCSVHGK